MTHRRYANRADRFSKVNVLSETEALIEGELRQVTKTTKSVVKSIKSGRLLLVISGSYRGHHVHVQPIKKNGELEKSLAFWTRSQGVEFVGTVDLFRACRENVVKPGCIGILFGVKEKTELVATHEWTGNLKIEKPSISPIPTTARKETVRISLRPPPNVSLQDSTTTAEEIRLACLLELAKKGQAEVRLRGSVILAHLLERDYNELQRSAIRLSLPPRSLTVSTISKKTGMTPEEVERLLGDFRTRMTGVFFELAKKGVTLRDFLIEDDGTVFDISGHFDEQGRVRQ